MTNKKTKSKSCCSTGKKLSPLLLIAIIILIAIGVFFLPSPSNKTPIKEGLVIDDTQPVIEMISDTVEVTIPEDTNTAVVPETNLDEEPIIILGEKNSDVSLSINNSEKLVQTFLSEYNHKRFKDACDIIVDTKCDDRIKGSVIRFGEEFEKMDGGYQNISVHQVDVPDFHSDIICVEYDYRYKASTNPNLIHEVMSFYVQDGKITYRICEGKTRDGVNIGCPIQARRDFCL